jgi:hypothetical protein
MEALVRFSEDQHVGAAIEEERQLLGQLVADGVASHGMGGQERDPHDCPSLDGASITEWKGKCYQSPKNQAMPGGRGALVLCGLASLRKTELAQRRQAAKKKTQTVKVRWTERLRRRLR